jgi:hypothetical protein
MVFTNPPVQPYGSYLNAAAPATIGAAVIPPTQESMAARRAAGLDALTPEQRAAGYYVTYNVSVGLGIGFNTGFGGEVTNYLPITQTLPTETRTPVVYSNLTQSQDQYEVLGKTSLGAIKFQNIRTKEIEYLPPAAFETMFGVGSLSKIAQDTQARLEKMVITGGQQVAAQKAEEKRLTSMPAVIYPLVSASNLYGLKPAITLLVGAATGKLSLAETQLKQEVLSTYQLATTQPYEYAKQQGIAIATTAPLFLLGAAPKAITTIVGAIAAPIGAYSAISNVGEAITGSPSAIANVALGTITALGGAYAAGRGIAELTTRTPTTLNELLVGSKTNVEVLLKMQRGETTAIGGKLTSSGKLLNAPKGFDIVSNLKAAFKSISTEVEPKTYVTETGALEAASKTSLGGQLEITTTQAAKGLFGEIRALKVTTTSFDVEQLGAGSPLYKVGNEIIDLSKSVSATGQGLTYQKSVSNIFGDFKGIESMQKTNSLVDSGFMGKFTPVEKMLIATQTEGATAEGLPIITKDISKVTDWFPSEQGLETKPLPVSEWIEIYKQPPAPTVDIIAELQKSYLQTSQKVTTVAFSKVIKDMTTIHQLKTIIPTFTTVGFVSEKSTQRTTAPVISQGFAQGKFEGLGSFLSPTVEPPSVKLGQDIWSSSSIKSLTGTKSALTNVVKQRQGSSLSSILGTSQGINQGLGQGLGQELGQGQGLKQLLGQQTQTRQGQQQTQIQLTAITPTFSFNFTGLNLAFPSWSQGIEAAPAKKKKQKSIVSRHYAYVPTVLGELSGVTIPHVPKDLSGGVRGVGIRYPVAYAEPRRSRSFTSRQTPQQQPQNAFMFGSILSGMNSRLLGAVGLQRPQPQKKRKGRGYGYYANNYLKRVGGF